jgi:hypothetical protein
MFTLAEAMEGAAHGSSCSASGQDPGSSMYIIRKKPSALNLIIKG